MEISGLSPFNLYLQQTYGSLAASTDGDLDFAKIAALDPVEDVDVQNTNGRNTSNISAMDAFNASKAGSFMDILAQMLDASQVQGTENTSTTDAVVPEQDDEPVPIEATEGSAGSAAASDNEESDSSEVTTQIVLNPDGSRQLEITTKVGNTEMVTAIQLSKKGEVPTEFQSAKAMNAYESNFMYATA
ncbi:MAG: hypothetical protein PHE02_01245 [Lachnospiraceae bacterium]|nr:hypothetical protein [Lachnospiraceae bacterium]